MARKVGLFLLILVAGGAVDAAWFIRRDVGLNIGAPGCHWSAGRFSGPAYSFQSEERHVLASGDPFFQANVHAHLRFEDDKLSGILLADRRLGASADILPEDQYSTDQHDCKPCEPGMASRVGTSTLPPKWPHFFSEASWSSKWTPAAPASIMAFISS